MYLVMHQYSRSAISSVFSLAEPFTAFIRGVRPCILCIVCIPYTEYSFLYTVYRLYFIDPYTVYEQLVP